MSGWIDPSQIRQLLPGGVHEVHVLGKWLADRPREGLRAAVCDEPPANLCLDLRLEPLDRRLRLVALEPFLERRQDSARRRLPGLCDQPFEHRVEIEIPQSSVEVVSPSDRPSRLHARRNLVTTYLRDRSEPGIGR